MLCFSFTSHGSWSEAQLDRNWWARTGSVVDRVKVLKVKAALRGTYSTTSLSGSGKSCGVTQKWDIKVQQEESNEHMVNFVHWWKAHVWRKIMQWLSFAAWFHCSYDAECLTSIVIRYNGRQTCGSHTCIIITVIISAVSRCCFLML